MFNSGWRFEKPTLRLSTMRVGRVGGEKSHPAPFDEPKIDEPKIDEPKTKGMRYPARNSGVVRQTLIQTQTQRFTFS
jgi:hypothetical protein